MASTPNPVFGSPEWRAKYGMKMTKKKPATATASGAAATASGAAGASKSPAFGSPEWRAKYGK